MNETRGPFDWVRFVGIEQLVLDALHELTEAIILIALAAGLLSR